MILAHVEAEKNISSVVVKTNRDRQVPGGQNILAALPFYGNFMSKEREEPYYEKIVIYL